MKKYIDVKNRTRYKLNEHYFIDPAAEILPAKDDRIFKLITLITEQQFYAEENIIPKNRENTGNKANFPRKLGITKCSN
jgi:hypothetical protein